MLAFSLAEKGRERTCLKLGHSLLCVVAATQQAGDLVFLLAFILD